MDHAGAHLSRDLRVSSLPPSRCVIREIGAEETIPLRWTILRAGLERETAIFPGDDDPETRHFASFAGEKMTGIASTYCARLPERPAVEAARQLRGMAVIPEARGLHHGAALVRHCELHARVSGAKLLWCNARTPAVEFYRRHGFQTLGAEFEIPTAGPHWRMFLYLP